MSKKFKRILIAYKKKVKPDPVYHSFWYSKCQNKLMLNGKKYLISKCFFQTTILLKKRWNQAPVYLLFKILMKIRPLLGIIKKRKRDKFLDVPSPIDARRKIILALKWFISYIRTYPARHLEERILFVFLDSYQKKYTPLTQKVQKHQNLINENRSNIRFRWK